MNMTDSSQSNNRSRQNTQIPIETRAAVTLQTSKSAFFLSYVFLLFWFNVLLLTHFENLTIVPQQNVSEKKVTSSNILNLGYLSEK